MYVINNTPGSRYMSKVVRPENLLLQAESICSRLGRSRPLHYILESWCGVGRMIIMQTMPMQYNPFKLFNNQYYRY